MRRRLRRLGILGGGLLGFILLLGLLALALLQLPAARRVALDRALPALQSAVFGELRVGEARWPHPSVLEVEGLLWTAEEDTLAAARRLRVRLALGALLRRDLHLRELVLEGGRLDLPALRRHAPVPETEATPAPESPPRFPRPGALPGLPSVALDSLSIELDPLRLVAEGPAGRLRLQAAARLLRDRVPLLRLRGIDADLPPHLGVAGGAVVVDLEQGTLDGALDLSTEAAGELALRLESDEQGQYRVELRSGDGWGLVLDGELDREGTRLDALTLEGELQLPDAAALRRMPALRERLGAIPEFRGSIVALRGAYDTGAEPRGWIELEAPPAPPLPSLSTRATWSEGTLTLAHGRAELGALSLQVEGERGARGERWETRARLRGWDGLRPWLGERPLPDPIHLVLDASLRSAPDGERELSADLRGSLSHGSTTLDSLLLQLAGPLSSGTEPLRVELAVAHRELCLYARGEAALEERRLLLEPLLLDEGPPFARLDRAPQGPRGTVVVDAGGRGARVRDLRLSGAAGELRAEGHWSAATGGELGLRIVWPTPPWPLRRGRDAAALDSLRTAWISTEALGVELRATLPPDARGDWRVVGDFRLPGPRQLAALASLPASLAELGRISGTLRAEGKGEEGTAALDLGRTEWVERARVRLTRSGTRLAADSLRFAARGLQLSGAASLEEERLGGRLELDLLDDRWVRSLLDVPLDSLDAAAELELGGTREAPDADARWALRASAPSWELPALTGEARVRAGRWQQAGVRAREGLRLGAIQLQTAGVELRPERPTEGPFPLWLSFGTTGHDLSLRQIARIQRDEEGWTIHGDSLGVRLVDRELASSVPFRLALRGEELRLEGLELEGSLGRISLEGHQTPETLRCELDIALTPPTLPEALLIPSGLWPQTVDLRLRAASPDTLRLVAELGGLRLGRGSALPARWQAESQGGRLRAEFHAGEFLHGSAELPGTLNLRPLRWEGRDEELRVELRARGLPLPSPTAGPEEIEAYLRGESGQRLPALDAELSLSGSARRPTGSLDATVGFPEWPRLAAHRIELRGNSTETGLDGELEWRKESRKLATGTLRVPLQWLADRPYPRVDEDAEATLRLDARNLELRDLNELLPDLLEVRGRMDVQLQAEGPLGNPRLAGAWRSEAMRVTLADGTDAHLRGQLDLAGKRTRPRITGQLEIQRARIPIPETSDPLHPTEPLALLWDEAGVGHPPVSEAAEPEGASPAEAVADSLDLDVDVHIPGAAWIKGRGLEVELAGDLQLSHHEGRPGLVGELQAVRGQLSFLGNRFEVEKGTVSFYGGDEIDPTLDLEMATQKDDTRILVRMTGTAKQPRLDLSSEPPMDEGDILAKLLFNQGLSQLDNEQTSFLESKVVGALRGFAIPQLEARISRQLGLDVFRLQPAGEGGTRVTVGKYLSPRALLKYEQRLEDTQDFQINLEYWLARRLKLDSHVSRQRSSGLELNWTTDY